MARLSEIQRRARMEAVIARLKDGMTPTGIGLELGISTSQVSRWADKAREEGVLRDRLPSRARSVNARTGRDALLALDRQEKARRPRPAAEEAGLLALALGGALDALLPAARTPKIRALMATLGCVAASLGVEPVRKTESIKAKRKRRAESA